ncbi:MAG TPA: TIGR03067 domain-containing protein [Candidatus Binatia bacterium]|nr:TIGR03067 domain-containing protein [Candidatus Binatia bacterium]
MRYRPSALSLFLVLFSLLLTCPDSIAEQKSAQNSPDVRPVSQKESSPSGSLDGKWKVIACQLNGTWLPESIFREFRYILADDERYSILWSELTFPAYIGGFPKSKSGRVTINRNSGPNQIDLTPDDGPFAGKPFQGIFELDHDILKANFSLPGNPRPAVFSAGQGQVYEVWLRVE